MSRKIPVYIFIIICFVLPLIGFAQTVAQIAKAADKKFEEGDYYAASLYYADALKKDADNAELNYKYAEACRMFNDYSNAAIAYAAASKNDQANQYPYASFWYGEMLKYTGKYEDAAKAFLKFRGRYHGKDYYSKKVQQEIESCAWAKAHVKAVDSIHVEHLGREVNTEASEFNAIPVYPDKLQFSSLRNISADKKKSEYLVRIYNQQPNPELIYTPAGANDALNIGNGTYSSDSKQFYFTQCEQKDKTNTRCDIYVTKYQDYKWGAAEKLSDHVNDAKASNTHPAIGKDLAGHDVLFFASDREGGQGNFDIWISKVDTDGSYQQAVNAGEKINSAGNELTPYYDLNSKTLFFSSDWHYGFGGYDIFESKGEYNSWSEPKNLLQPVNSSQNDLYYILNPNDSKAYITSNRKGSYFIEAETCCNDIYAYNTNKKIERKPDTVAVVAQIKKDTVPVPHPELNPVFTSANLRNRIDEKIKNIKQHLPLALYFHNDEPDHSTLGDTTSLEYKQTYEAYTGLISEYRKEYSKKLKGDEKQKAVQEVNDFFSQKVDQGFYDLIAFSSQLLDILKAGNKVELTIKGYCSPLNYNQYNIKLGYRRVASLKNYFNHYQSGILQSYITDGTLVLKSESFGEETASKQVSDNLRDTRNSVYSPAAALERRVEIISVELK